MGGGIPGVTVPVERRQRYRDDPGLLGQAFGEGAGVGLPERCRIGDGEVARLGHADPEADLAQPAGEQVAACAEVRGEVVEDGRVHAQTRCDRGLEGSARGVGQPLLGAGDRCDQLGTSGDPPDLPPGHREGLSRRGDRDRAVLRAGQGRGRPVRGIEGQVLVDLVGDDQRVMPRRLVDDRLQHVGSEHQTGGVVRGVHEHQPGPRGEGRAQRLAVHAQHQVPVGRGVRGERDRPVHAAGQGDRRRVLVVERLEGEHLVARLDEREDRRRERFGRPGRDQDLRGRIPVQPVPGRLVRGHGLPQRGDPRPGRVLVRAAADRLDGGLGHDRGRRVVGIALAEVQRVMRGGLRGHLREHGGAGLAAHEQAGSGGGTGPGS